jgi:hypothetical protein
MGMRYYSAIYLKSGCVCTGNGKYQWKPSKYEFVIGITYEHELTMGVRERN